jgi:alpha,alpha-trehalase
MTREQTPPYAPIRDYAIVGDCHGCALISRAGSVDWCAFGRLDAPPVFCRLLDATEGGFLSLAPAARSHIERTYLPGTNILRTVFSGPEGEAAVTDFMPVGRRPGAGAHDYVSLLAPGLLVRCVEGLSGTSRFDLAFRPSSEYGAARVALTASPGEVSAGSGTTLYADLPFRVEGDVARASFAVRAGERCFLVVAPHALARAPAANELERLLAITTAYWEEWIAYCRYRGPYRDMVARSALALKLLTYAPTGAIVAAATTSLPEQIGGERNWDYRYCWLRDASLTLYGLALLGYGGEARAFAGFMTRVCRERPGDVQIMYGVSGEADLPERTLDHLEGYRGSRPVRVGNEAYRQRQLDVYGEFVEWAHLFTALGGKLDGDGRRLIERLVNHAARLAHEPDHGIWEARRPPLHYVHGKMMAWVALDRGLRMLGERAHWRAARERLCADVLRQGIDREAGHLVQAYGRPGTDAALLLAPMVGFPLEEGIFERTVGAIERELRRGDYVLRYRTDDGLSGSEGAFVICSFWLVDAYLALGRHPEARALFERLCRKSNDVGLFSEEIDPADDSFLGNFPQAFTHLALIGNAIHLELCDKYGPQVIAGGHADRARRTVGATFGWRALWEACKASGRVGRFWSSRRSLLPHSLMPL